MKKTPENFDDVIDQSSFFSTKKTFDKKKIFLGLGLCFFLGILIYLLSAETKSVQAHLEGAREVVFSPVEGTVWELPQSTGTILRKGEPLLRFNPAYVREQNTLIREQLTFFQQNRHNTGTLKQKFRPLFSSMFDTLNTEYKSLAKIEAEIKALYQEAKSVHVGLQLQMRDPKNKDEKGLPKQELVAQEEKAAADMLILEQKVEEASLARANMDLKISKVTADLNQPHGILYRYLEEQNQHVQNLVRHEYLYAQSNGVLGEIFVKKGDIVEKGTALYEILPENSGQIWVIAEFNQEDAKKLKERQVCRVLGDNKLEFEARIITITENRENNTSIVRLFVQNAPPSLVQEVNMTSSPNTPPIFVTVIAQ